MGNIDAIIVPAEHPISLLTELSDTAAAEIRFMDFGLSGHVAGFSREAELSQYQFQQRPVHVLKMRTLLVAAADTPRDIISRVQACFRESQLVTQTNYSKWKNLPIQ
jgi:TRAP-type uncharacterized transport system substrate-binding protein